MRCPICKKPVEVDHSNERSSHPFCSERCKLIDLGRWLSGKYVIPVEMPQESAGDEPGPASENP